MSIQNNAFQNEFTRMLQHKSEQSNSGGKSSNSDRPKARFWLNVGILTKVTNAEGEQVDHFVALPQGIPLDTMEPLAIRGQNMDYRARLSAQNDLLQQAIAVATTLAPGETKLLTSGGTGLQVQVRHVAAEAEAIASEDNSYAVQLVL